MTVWAESVCQSSDPRVSSGQSFSSSAKQLYAEGWAALVSASAARPQGRVLCVYRTQTQPLGTTPLPPPTTVVDAPIVPTGLRT